MDSNFKVFQKINYQGDNLFIKTYIDIVNKTLNKSKEIQLVYYGIDKDDFHNIFYFNYSSRNYYKPRELIGGIKLQEINLNEIELYLIAVNPEIRQSGLGTFIMEHLIESSIKTGISIILKPSNIYNYSFGDWLGGIGKSKEKKIKVKDLPKWYSKFGFKLDKSIDDNSSKQMIFNPTTF